MRRARIPFAAPAVAALLLGLAAAAGGCGEKIAIPEAEGLFGLREYSVYLTMEEDDPRQLVQVQGSVLVLTRDALVKRSTLLTETGRVSGLADPRALCVGLGDELVFVWDQGTRTVSWYDRSDLAPIGAAVLAEPQRVVGMAASARGASAVPAAETFLYLSDPDAGVIHRYAFDRYGGLTPWGILAGADGASVRYVHRAGALAVDREEHLLVCDVDPLRHWVIRFDPTPDEEDEDLRGVAALFDPVPRCQPVPAADEYVLGNAPGCGQTDWAPGPLDTTGVFDLPGGVAVDGSGRIFVADTNNDRVQIFHPAGDHDMTFGNPPRPVSIAVFDYAPGTNSAMYGAFVYVILPETGAIRSFISSEYKDSIAKPPPPPE